MESKSIKIIKVPNKLNIESTGEFRLELNNLVEQGEINIIIDFFQCEFIDSAGLGILVSSFKKIMEQKGSLKLAALNDTKVLKIFQLTKLDKVFEIYPTLEEAEKSYN